MAEDPTLLDWAGGAPAIRRLIDEKRRLTRELGDTAARVEALKPEFARLLAAVEVHQRDGVP